MRDGFVVGNISNLMQQPNQQPQASGCSGTTCKGYTGNPENCPEKDNCPVVLNFKTKTSEAVNG